MSSHSFTHTHAHICITLKYTWIEACKWLPPLRHPCLSFLTCMYVCIDVYACMCACMWGLHPPTHYHPPQGWNPQMGKKINGSRMNQDISILFEDWTSVKTPPPLSRCMVWWMSGWVGSSQIIQNRINLDIFILDIFWTFFLKPPQPFVGLFLYNSRTVWVLFRKCNYNSNSEKVEYQISNFYSIFKDFYKSPFPLKYVGS